MDRINGADTVDIGGGRRGFRDENLQTGISGTEVTAAFLNGLQEEVLQVITQAGLAPSNGDWTQLWQALQIHGLSTENRSRRWLAVNSMTLSSAPGSPVSGDTYLIPSGASGIWSANVGKIAQWTGSAWSYLTPPNGHGLSLPDGRIFEKVNGAYVEKLALDAQSGKWNYAVAGGTANALVATINPAPASLVDGLTVALRPSAANTGATTFNLNNLGTKPVINQAGGALLGDEFAINGDVIIRYNTGLNSGAGAWVLLTNSGGTAHSITPSAGDNSTKVANTAFTNTAVVAATTGLPRGAGWKMTADGGYECWGTAVLSGNNLSTTVTLPITFPNEILDVKAQDIGSGADPLGAAAASLSSITVMSNKYILDQATGNTIVKTNSVSFSYRVLGR